MKKFIQGVAVGVALADGTTMGYVLAVIFAVLPWLILGLAHFGPWVDEILWKEIK